MPDSIDAYATITASEAQTFQQLLDELWRRAEDVPSDARVLMGEGLLVLSWAKALPPAPYPPPDVHWVGPPEEPPQLTRPSYRAKYERRSIEIPAAPAPTQVELPLVDHQGFHLAEAAGCGLRSMPQRLRALRQMMPILLVLAIDVAIFFALFDLIGEVGGAAWHLAISLLGLG